jgi:hypothetical protein
VAKKIEGKLRGIKPKDIKSVSGRKNRIETFFTQMSLLQNGKFTSNSRF